MPYPSRAAWLFQNETQGFYFWPRLDGMSITASHPEGLANFDGQVVDAAEALTFEPEDHIIITFGGTRIFAGHLKAVTEDQSDETGPRIWTLSAQDYTAKLDDAIIRRRTTRKKERVNRRVRWIMSYMRSNIWSVDSLDLSGMPNLNPVVEAYDYYGNTVREALDQVAEEVRLNFYIDFENVFHIFRNEVFDSPFDLKNTGFDLSASFPFRVWSHTRDSSELGNAILVEPEQRKDSRWTRDAASVAAYGRQERFISDQNLGGPIAASNVGERALAGVKDPQREATLECWEPGILPGMRVDVTEGLWDHVDERFWVRRVEINAVDPHDAAGEAYLRSLITIADRLNPTLRRSGGSSSPGTTVDTGEHPLADFPDEVSPPSVSDGSAIGSLTAAGQVRASRIFDGGADTYTEIPFGWHPGLQDEIYMGYGLWHGHTNRPSFTSCSGLDYSNTGYQTREQWFTLVMPPHPADVAGIKVSVGIGSSKGYSDAGINVIVRDAQPTAIKQGQVVGTVPVGATTDVVIPASLLPAEGEKLWVGLVPAWTATGYADTFAYYCGFPSPNGSQSYQMDSAGTPWQGYTGEAVWTSVTSTWQVYDSSAPAALGTTTAHDDEDDVPWEGGNTIEDAGFEGDGGAWEFTGGEFIVSADSPSAKGITVVGQRETDDDSEPWGPWSDLGWSHSFKFRLTAHGDTAADGTREIQSIATGEGEKAIGTVHLGDMNRAEGISVSSPSVTEYLAKDFTLDEVWQAKFDTRSGLYLRGKVWRVADGEPAEWDVQVALDETADEQDRWDMWIRAGNDGSTQTAAVSDLRAAVAGVSGQQIMYEVLGFSSGGRVFKVTHPFRVDEFRPYVNGTASEPLAVQPAQGEFTLDFWTTERSIIAASYVID